MTDLLEQVLALPHVKSTTCIPPGKCQCGCERSTQKAKNTDYRAGVIRGEYLRFFTGHQRRLPIRDRFWRYVRKDSKNKCWIWLGCPNENGYGSISGWLDGRRYIVGAHRMSWMIHHGTIPEGKWVLHKCDNPPCVNPKHLFLGDSRLNIDDMMIKGRNGWKIFKGQNNGSSVLKDSQVKDIKKRLAKGSRGIGAELAQEFGVSRSLISAIKNGLLWRHIQ
jgi:hypothetical protein